MRSAGEQIFENLYRVNISNAVTSRPETELFKIGNLSDDENGYNNYMAETSTHYRTINNIIELFRMGILVTFDNYIDAGNVYNLLNEHLNDWEEVLANPVRCQEPPPVEDIILIQQYMESIYELAEFANGTINASRTIEDRKFKPSFLSLFGGVQTNFPVAEPVEDAQVSDAPVLPGAFFAELMNRQDNG